ncbi:MAG: YtxH domain-containing protein [Candidatus Magasanikbacteria bacterium]|jgi:hypothetical protein|nr:YtxH domain-containing protein [Candidatus Magasanikbacteria bacterium]MBT4221470.1 YtxH domain-containing protein [Candidatus Magasanikbacteria bacterium]MBT4350682.1 YtxH domain-containing protein [Candidatus Magasanikbacteria bacterium]MBT4541642.1 YtxH domain-containing protein [Candidatus Magasanikbacteria bacterium]MBT6252915.1 YtxH domain-containing protein [Candidatus Magasanikbacteria bacterium]
MGKFNKGVFFGGLLGAGLMWLNTTKKGKAVREEMLDHASTIYADLFSKIQKTKQWQKMKKGDYTKVVKSTVASYAKKHNLPTPMVKMVTKVLNTQWGSMIKDLKDRV